MFLNHFRLQQQPFGDTPDPRYLFLSAGHREALASLLRGIMESRGFLALVAEPGMGKTTLLFQLLQWLDKTAKTVFLFQAQSSPLEFLRSVLLDMGIEDDGADLVQIRSRLNAALVSEARSGRRFLLVIDEAQTLDDGVLETVRMLSNFETPQKKLMQIVLSGQPRLAEKLTSPDMVQLRQRLSVVAHLRPFSANETSLYIDHRLRVAGYDFRVPLFTGGARETIARASGGIPRNINTICFNALSLGCALKQQAVDEKMIGEVLVDQDLNSMAKVHAAPLAHTHKKPVRTSYPKALRNWLPRLGAVSTMMLLLSWSIPAPDGSRTFWLWDLTSPRLTSSGRQQPGREHSKPERTSLAPTPAKQPPAEPPSKESLSGYSLATDLPNTVPWIVNRE